MHSPYSAHLVAAKRVLRYINGSLGSGIVFRKSDTDAFLLTAFLDFDWTGDSLDHHSTSSYGVFFDCNPISWSTTVSSSSTEVEYRALACIAAKVFWLPQLLQDLRIYGSRPPLLLCANMYAIQLAKNHVFHGRTKHVEIDFHYVRERVVRKDIQLQFLPTIS